MSETTGIDWREVAGESEDDVMQNAYHYMFPSDLYAICEWAAQIALSRHASGVTEEREWISVNEQVPEWGETIFIRWGDGSPDVSDLQDKRIMDKRMLDLMGAGKVGWWCKRIVLIDSPPPFNQHGQNDE